jgi:hypothetical protein
VPQQPINAGTERSDANVGEQTGGGTMNDRAFKHAIASPPYAAASLAAATADKGHIGTIVGAAGVLAVAGLVLWAVPASLPAAVSRCQLEPHRLSFVPESKARLTVKGNIACAVSARLGAARVNAMNIVELPRHGRLRPRGRTGVIYRPDADFKGEDDFAFTMHGVSTSYKGDARVRVAVIVQ